MQNKIKPRSNGQSITWGTVYLSYDLGCVLSSVLEQISEHLTTLAFTSRGREAGLGNPRILRMSGTRGQGSQPLAWDTQSLRHRAAHQLSRLRPRDTEKHLIRHCLVPSVHAVHGKNGFLGPHAWVKMVLLYQQITTSRSLDRREEERIAPLGWK